MELISMIVPVYNVENYVGECIESLLNQSYQMFEILLINDGSTDGSMNICASYAEKDQRIKLIDQHNQGLSMARNRGIEEASGKYITFVDSDDVVDSEYLKQLYQAIQKYQAPISISGFCYLRGKEKEFHSSNEYFERQLTAVETLERMYRSLPEPKETYVTACWKLFDRKLFNDVRFPKGKYHEDEFTIHQLYFQAEKIIYIHQPLYYYRQRETSIMNSGYRLSSLDYLLALQERKRFLEENGIDAASTELAYYYALSKHRYFLKKYQHQKEYQQVNQAFQKQFKKLYPTWTWKTKLKEQFKKYTHGYFTWSRYDRKG